jgi:hypothetical protein
MIVFCRDKRRRDHVLQTPGLNGIDYLEVLGPAGCGTQLALTFLKDSRSLALTPDNVVLAGDTTLQVTGIELATDDDPLTITVVLDSTGDFSRYTLTLVSGSANSDAPPGVDPQLTSVDFSFKAGCPSPADCQTRSCCPASPVAAPDIHYLARDYDGFRQAMLDRMAALVPSWTEAHAADPGITLVEALAFAADRISYLQDAVNTEAYIGTARSRISLRRHARLVDYRVQEGANARAWICLTTSIDGLPVPAGTQIYPLVPGLPPSIDPDSYAAAALLASPGPVFETLADAVLYIEQKRMDFYTWSDGQCCLAAGATEATLDGVFSSLKAGDVLIFEEIIGPLTGDAADADPFHRCAVRLTVASTLNQSGQPLRDPVNGKLLTRIEWEAADAIPFPLCLSSVTDADHDSQPLTGVSVARGNVLAADQGQWNLDETLGTVPQPPHAPAAETGCACTDSPGVVSPRPRYRPTLAHGPLTFAVSYDAHEPASRFLAPDVSSATPQIVLTANDGSTWVPLPDLLKVSGDFTGFVPEIESDGTAHLRFGDGTHGASPALGLTFTATYRTGNGAAGNVGRDTLAHMLISGPGITSVRNPLAAAGGTDPESMEHIRQVAPFNFQTQLRCVTASDYGDMAEGISGIAEAKGTMRWTGSWYTAFTSVEASGASNDKLSTSLQRSVKTGLNSLRMLGTDLVVEAARLIGLRIGLNICVAPSYFQGDVYAAIWKVLVAGDPCGGTRGLLGAANFQFGETVYSSPIIAAAQHIAGVVAVTLTTFERMDAPMQPGAVAPTQLTMGRLEIPRCDNDPNHADRGLLVLTMDGGK